MKILALLFTSAFVFNAHPLSGMDFIGGGDPEFNHQFVKKYINSGLKTFSATDKMTNEFKEELAHFLKSESKNLFFKGDASDVKNTKFKFYFKVKDESLEKVYLMLFSSSKVLSTWDLLNFKKIKRNYAPFDKALPASCSKIGPSIGDVDSYSVDLASDDCSAYSTKASLGHPAFKGVVEVFSEQKKTMLVVKHLMPGMTSVPKKIKEFSVSWRTPPSTYFNNEEFSELFMP
jgi:hypothetical protein